MIQKLKVVSCYDILNTQKATWYITLKHSFFEESIYVRFDDKLNSEKSKLVDKLAGVKITLSESKGNRAAFKVQEARRSKDVQSEASND